MNASDPILVTVPMPLTAMVPSTDPLLPKPLVIYHGNCADGFAAAWVFRHMGKFYGMEFDFYPGVYQEDPPDCKNRLVYLVDFSYKRAVVEKICKEAFHVVLVDHHKTAIDDLSFLIDEGSPYYQENFGWYVDLERSGAMLAWDYWHTDSNGHSLPYMNLECPPLLKHIQDRDLWKFLLPGTREISAALFSYPYDFDTWDKLITDGEDGVTALASQGVAIERKHHKDIAELVAVTKRMMVIGTYTIPAASLPYTYSSDAGHLMATNYLSGTVFAACYWDTATARVFSLRSAENGIDVSEIAKAYGGGGHFHAAGFSVPRTHQLACA